MFAPAKLQFHGARRDRYGVVVGVEVGEAAWRVRPLRQPRTIELWPLGSTRFLFHYPVKKNPQ